MKHKSTLFLTGLFATVFAYNQACNEPASTQEPTSVENQQILRQLGEGVLVPNLMIVQEELTGLQTALLLYQEDTSDVHRQEAQEKWKSVMEAWQHIELMQFGPAGSSVSFIAGQDLRDEIYSWPTTNPCRVDQKTSTEEYKNSTFFEDNLVNSYGLDALEHLLFSEIETICPSQVSPVSDGLWDSLGEEKIINNRIEFALTLTEDILARNLDLIEIWQADNQNFLTDFETGSGPYTSTEESMKEAFHALFYIEKYTKDKKLAQPLGLKDCTEDYCIDDLEGILSTSSLESIIANLRGFEITFTGGEGQGFDDLLQQMGHGDLSDQIILDTQNAISYAETLRPLKEQIVTDKDSVMELYDLVANVTSALKYELPVVLSIEIPTESAGDND